MGKSRRERRGVREAKTKAEKEQKESVKAQEEIKPKVSTKRFFKDIYEHKYKKLMIIPFTLILLAIIIIGLNVVQTGDFINKAVSLTGGVTLTIPSQGQTISITDLSNSLNKEYPNSDINIRELSDFGTQIAVIVEASDITEDQLKDASRNQVGDLGDYSIETLGPSLGASFFKQTMIAIVIAFVFMALVVFWYFRTFVPSSAVVLAAFSDILVTLAVVDLFGMKISSAGIAAFLMLIGYSVDTDILLSTRVLKKKEGSVMSRIYSAMRTGLTMNLTTMAAVSIALILSNSQTISQIMTIILIGLFVDMVMTWIQNVAILRLYLEKKHE